MFSVSVRAERLAPIRRKVDQTPTLQFSWYYLNQQPFADKLTLVVAV
jgi:hypothetical protein